MMLAELFPQEDYGFRMRFERGTLGEFFRPSTEHESLLCQRKYWLESAPESYAAMLPAGADLLDEVLELATSEGTLGAKTASAVARETDAWRRCVALGTAWEPDFLLLKSTAAGEVRLVGGCVCFPSSWSLSEKVGHPIERIHGVVPGLNEAIGTSIQSFLAKLRPGVAWLRANWGLSRSPELNQHPQRQIPRLDGSVEIGEVWLRVERQALMALPRTSGILFGIRIELHPLTQIREDRSLARGLIHALRTMAEEMARYKNIATARARLLDLLSIE